MNSTCKTTNYLKKPLKYYIKMHAEVAKCNHAISEMMLKSEEKKREEEKVGCL